MDTSYQNLIYLHVDSKSTYFDRKFFLGLPKTAGGILLDSDHWKNSCVGK